MSEATTRRCAVLGSPIGHSLSPVLHRAAYEELGLGWSYDAQDVAASELAAFLDGLGAEWRGLSLTMPLKRAVLPLVDAVSERVRLSGAANTVLLDPGRRSADNTDIPGATAALRERVDHHLGKAVVLGGGATATSVVHALADFGCTEVTLLVRDPGRAVETVTAARRHPAAPTIDVRPLGTGPVSADVLVSTLPASAQTEELLRLVEPVQVVFDVGYDPWPTPFVTYARSTGRVLVSGLDLLVHQAALQVELMTGRSAPLAVMRAAGEQELRLRGLSTGAPERPL